MKHQLFKNWLLELRSGKYTQIRRDFYGEEGEACALGVLGHTISGFTESAPNQVILGRLPHGMEIWEHVNADDIPHSFQAGTILGIQIVDQNDNYYTTFPELADMLEKAYYEHFPEGGEDESPAVQGMAATVT